MTESKSMILGCAGKSLTREEIRFYRSECPWGFILFARNVSEPEQIRDLVASMRDCIGRPDAPVFIDQEGGRVQRLRPPLAPNYPAGAALGALWRDDHDTGERAAWLLGRLHAFDLSRYDLSSDCLPVLDVPVEGASDVIGARAYGKEPESVSRLGRAAADGLMAGGVLPVMKHTPGHGRAFADTHKELARVGAPLCDLVAHDFVPFKALKDLPMAMTAHVIFDCIDPERPSTLSPTVIGTIIRDVIGFDGLVMSDDISMKGLSGELDDLAVRIIDAGCDMVLYCAGVMEELKKVGPRVPVLKGKARHRADLAEVYAGEPDLSDEQELRAEFDSLLPAVA